MTDGEALRAAVVADPDEDLPRLMYADWLDENNQSDRGAFVRAQVEAARLEPFCPAARELEQRAEKLLARHRYDWTKHLGVHVEAGFERGFIESIAVHAVRFPHVAETCFSAEPIRTLRIIRPRKRDDVDYASLEPVFASPHLCQLTALELPDVCLEADENYLLSDSVHATGLKELSLGANPLSPEWVRQVIAGEYFPGLVAVDLADAVHLGEAVHLAITKGCQRRFKRLDLSGIHFYSGPLKQVLGSKPLKGIEELRMRWEGGPVRPGPLTHLDIGWVIPWKKLCVLDLAGQGFGPEGVRELCRAAESKSLRWLGLAANAIGSEGAQALCEETKLNLYYLDLRDNGLTHRDASMLRERFAEAEVIV